jgi:anti-sigma regulatory factor (Ser/Thr protein kinase)
LSSPERAGSSSRGAARPGRAAASARWSFAASREAPGHGRRAIRAFVAPAEPTAWALDAIVLCVTEALSNVVVHAYRDQGAGRIEMEAELDGDSLCVRVRDHGLGFTPRVDSPGLGLGLPLIARLSAHAHIASAERGSEIIMRFDVRDPGRDLGKQ